ncbi:membrane protein DedA, SNARE-associated domain [Rhodobacter sp. 24-YEA-8]|nr:membrane protein DedA, SNARE-associated domain [Rhodobacter sp. 24-YEA-8]
MVAGPVRLTALFLIPGAMEIINDIVMPMARSPWIYLIVFLCVMGDGFIPPVPAETVVVPLAALAAAESQPLLWPLMLAAALGSVLGDHVAYGAGRMVDRQRLTSGYLRRLEPLIMKVEAGLEKRLGLTLVSMRYLPGLRITTNLAAGMVDTSYWRFLPWCTVAGICWALFMTLAGYLAGHWFGENTWIAIIVALFFAMTVSLVLEWAVKLLPVQRCCKRFVRAVSRASLRQP